MTRFSCTVLGVLAALAVAGAAAPVNAGDTQSFIIAPRDGYGVSECLDKATGCGRVVADAYCESHGLSKALSYGHVEDVTATIPRPAAGAAAAQAAALRGSTARTEPGSYVINCQP